MDFPPHVGVWKKQKKGAERTNDEKQRADDERKKRAYDERKRAEER